MKNIFGVIFLLLLGATATAQKKQLEENIISGRWKTVKHDYRGVQKFTIEQAEQIETSILNLRHHKYYYSNAKFLNPCPFAHIEITPFDTTYYHGFYIENIYYKKDLAKAFDVELVDEIGNSACPNDCSDFILKQDTLINICGGYTFYMIKVKNEKSFSGRGTTTKEIALTGEEVILNLSYEFFSEPYELIIYDENNKQLYDSGAKTTNVPGNKIIQLNNVTKLIFRMNAKEKTSRWKFSTILE